MTANHIADRRNLTKLASHVDAILTDMTEKIAEKISSLNNEIKDIDTLSPTNEAEERAKALSATQTQLEATEQQLLQVKKDAGWGGLLAPVQTWRTYKDVRRAKGEHARATEKFESPEERAKRTSRVSEHNQNVLRERDRLPGLEQDLGESERESTDLTIFRQQVAEAITAARADGWIAPNFPEKFQAMAQHLEAGKLAEATGCLSELVFQRKPSTQTYESWCQEATGILEKAYQDYRGFTPAGAYTEIAGRSIALARPTLRADSLRRLTKHTHTADQWQMLAAILTDPRSLRTDVLWAVYWSMFQCSHWLAKALAQAEVNEDLFTGK